MTELNLASLLSALRLAGIGVGFAEQARLKHIFALTPQLDSETAQAQFKSLLRAVLLKDTEQSAAFERVCNAWLDSAEAAVQRHAGKLGNTTQQAQVPSLEDNTRARKQHPADRQTSRRRYLWLAAALGSVAIIAAWLYFYEPATPQQPPPGTETTAVKDKAQATTPRAQLPDPESILKLTFTDQKPQIQILPPEMRWNAWRELTLGLTAALAGVALWWWQRRRNWFPQPLAAPSVKGPPRILLGGAPGAFTLLDTDQQQSLVWGIDRFIAETPTRKLDLRATVRATARAAGIATPHFQAARHQREMWLWLDASADDPSLARLAQEITQLLPAHGLSVEQATFHAVPWRLIGDQGQAFAANEIEERSHAALVVILTDGRLLMQLQERDDERVRIGAALRYLSHWPQLWFVAADNTALGALLAPYGLACIHPSELAARLTGGNIRAAATAEPDARVWAAACAVSPEPVSEAIAWQLRRQLNLRLTPWSFAAMQQQAGGAGSVLNWSTAQRAQLVNWLSDAQVQGEGGTSLLGASLDFFLDAIAGEDARRTKDETGWQDSPAQRQLHMQRALLQLWHQPSVAITALYRLYPGALAEPIRRQLAQLEPRDWASGERICMPWSAHELSSTEQHMLLAMGFGGNAPQTPQPQRPGRIWLAIGLCAGLSAAALLFAILRPMQPVTGAPRITHDQALPTAAKISSTQLPNGKWRISASTPRWLVQSDEATDGSRVRVDWQPRSQPCVETIGQRELWRCAGRASPPRVEPALHRNVIVLAAAPAQARNLAIALLASGNADVVLIDPQWPAGRSLIVDTAAARSTDSRVLVVHANVAATWSLTGAAGDAEIALAPRDWQTLAAALEFNGKRSLADLWPGARVLAGDAKKITIAGLGQGCQPYETTDQASGMVFVELCPGTFVMGSPPTEKDRDDDEAQHEVTLSAFAIGKYEVTNAQYRRYKPAHRIDDNKPVVDVNWNDAKAYCEHYGYSLPTEAQWEYAARATGLRTRWSFGDDEARLKDYAWYNENSGIESHEVGTRKPNAWGLHDMHGNVWEWVADWYGKYYTQPQTDPTGPTAGTDRVLRGGAFSYGPWGLRSAFRDRGQPEIEGRGIGLRCARPVRRQP